MCSPRDDLRCTRVGNVPSYRSDTVGFRCARDDKIEVVASLRRQLETDAFDYSNQKGLDATLSSPPALMCLQ